MTNKKQQQQRQYIPYDKKGLYEYLRDLQTSSSSKYARLPSTTSRVSPGRLPYAGVKYG